MTRRSSVADVFRRRALRAPRGATLIELMISLALLGGILSVTVGLLVGAIQNGTRARARSQLLRQGQFVGTLLANELRMAGLGVPDATAGVHITDSYAGAGATTFDTDVILANATSVGVIGDFARPDAQYNALGPLANRPAGSKSNVMWQTENNGSCAPTTVAASCDTKDTSTFFPGETGCNTTAKFGDRTCPWGMKRVVAGERIQVVAGSGAWTHAGVANPIASSALGAAGVVSLNLSTTWDAAWPNVAAGDLPVGASGAGWVTTIDRVFYNFNSTNKTIERTQCFGDPDPQNANWPNLAGTALPSTASLALTPTGGAQNTCVGPEVVAQNVSSVAFSYFDGTGAAIATPVSGAAKANIRRVDWVIKLRKVVNNRNVDQDIVGTAALRAFQ